MSLLTSMNESTADTRDDTSHMDLDPEVATSTIQKMDDNRIGFSDFPAEVRNRIYELALTRSRNLRLCNVNVGLDRAIGTKLGLNSTRVFPSIPRTCRKVNEEATPLLYGDNTFQLDTCFDFVNFVHAIGGSVQHLRSIEVPRAVWNTRSKRISQRELGSLRQAKGMCKFVIESDRGHGYERPIIEMLRVLIWIREEQRADGKEEMLEIVQR